MNIYLKITKLLSILCLILVASTASANNQATGNVVSVLPHSGWGGILVQLDNSTSFVYETACPYGNLAFVPYTEEAAYKSMLATLLAAKATGTPVIIYTNGCVAVTGGSLPHILAVEYGIRN